MNKIQRKIADLKYRKKLLQKKYKSFIREDKRRTLFERIRACDYDKLFYVSNPDILFDINEVTKEKRLDVPEDVKFRIDYSNVNFENAYIRGENFFGMRNVVINPQLISKKDMRDTILEGVNIIGSLDDVYVTRADFTGSVGGFLYPTRVYEKDLTGTNLNNVVVVNDFTDVIIKDTIIDPALLLSIEEEKYLRKLKKQIKSNQ